MKDTRQKRTSMMRHCQPWVAALPVPDGTINQADRQQFMWSYSGILWGVAVVPMLPLYAAILNDDVGYGAILRA